MYRQNRPHLHHQTGFLQKLPGGGRLHLFPPLHIAARDAPGAAIRPTGPPAPKDGLAPADHHRHPHGGIDIEHPVAGAADQPVPVTPVLG